MSNQCKLVVLIGLPGSGKTTLAKIEYPEYELFDDFISQFYNGKLAYALQNNKNVCVADPRLCVTEVFLKYMPLLEQYSYNLKIILFENNVETCLNNIKNRDKRKGIEDAINNYSKKYDPYSNIYKKWPNLIKPCYTNQ
jgi:predicted kinase